MKLIALSAAAILIGGCLVACVSAERLDADPLVVARQLEAAGFKGRAVIVFGTGHVAGQAFNLSGSSGFIEFSIEPKDGRPE